MSWPHPFLLLLSTIGTFSPWLTTSAAAAEKFSDLRGVVQASFNHDASRVIVRPRDGDVAIWELSTGKSIPGDVAAGSDGYLMSGDGKLVVIGFKDGHCRVFDATTAKAISPMLDFPLKADYQMPGPISPAGDAMLLFNEKEAVVFGIPDGKRIATIPLPAGPNEETPGSAAFAANGAQCFIMDGGGEVTRYETKDWKPMGKPMRHPGGDSAYDFEFKVSEDGKWLATSDTPGENGPKGQFQVWDAVAGKPLGEPLSAMNGFIYHFVGPNSIAIIPCRGADAHLRELPSMNVVSSFDTHQDLDGMSLDVSPDRKWILTWGEDGRLDLFDAATGKIKSRYPQSARVRKVMMAPDSSGCFVFFDNSAFPDQNHHDDYIIRLSLPELKVTESLRSLEGVSSVSLSPDGKRVMVHQGSSDKERLLSFDAATLKPLK